MIKTYFLGLPLFHVVFFALTHLEVSIYRLQAETNHNMAPATLTLIVFFLLYFGGYFLLSFFFGWRLGAKHMPSSGALIRYSLLNIVLSFLFSLLYRAPYFSHYNVSDLLPVAQQALGFLFGSLIARSRKEAYKNVGL